MAFVGLLGKSLQGVMAMVPMTMEIYARHPETGEKCFRLLCKDESVANGILRILKTKFPTSTKMETDPYCRRYMPAALLAGADYRNGLLHVYLRRRLFAVPDHPERPLERVEIVLRDS